MKILIIKNDGIGDLILASGLISFIGKNITNQLDLLTCETNKDVAIKIENLNEIFYVSRDSIKKYSLVNKNRIQIPLRMAQDNCQIVRLSKSEQLVLKKVNKKNYDLVIVLRRYIRQSSLLLLNLIDAKQKLCMWETPTNLSFDSAKKLSSYSTHLTTYNLDKYIRPELEYYEAILSLYFQQKIYADPFLSIPAYDVEQDSMRVGVIISGGSVQIDLKHWMKLLNYVGSLGYHVTLFGGKEQQQLAKNILLHLPTIDSRVGQYGFDEYPKAFANVSYIIGNDTGLTHFATLMQKKTLVLLGGGTFRSFFPWRKTGPQQIVFSEMECYNCLWVCHKTIKYECINNLFDNTLLYEKVKLFLSQQE